MWNHSFVAAIIIACAGNTSLPIQRYDFPGNRNVSKSKFYAAEIITTAPHDHRYIAQSIRLIPWSDYAGAKDTEKTISPDRMVWEVLRVDCRVRATPDYVYFFMANDAQTGKELTKREFQYITDLKTLPQIQARGPNWKLNRRR